MCEDLSTGLLKKSGKNFIAFISKTEDRKMLGRFKKKAFIYEQKCC